MPPKHDLDAILLEVLGHFASMPHRIRVDWVDLDAVDPIDFDEVSDWACVTNSTLEPCIGLHPSLRSAPRYVVRFLIFHEVLHLAIPPHAGVAHHVAFRVAERLWPDYHRANAWLDSREPSK